MNILISTVSEKPILLVMLLTAIVLGFSYPLIVFATHISKPIPYLEKTEFLSNETIDLQGGVEYDNEPAPEVLVQVSLEKQLNKLTSESVTSNVNGNFSATLSIPNGTESGNYTVGITSHCQKIHINECIYQMEELSITIKSN
jgi:preprotein translocase subunit SecD